VVVKSKCGFVTRVTASLAATAFLLNQHPPPPATALLLGDIILMLVVCRVVLAPARAENGLPAGEWRGADGATTFHMTSKVGLQAYHIHHRE
jgi:hypothetical protein